MILRDKDKEALIKIFSTVQIPIEVWAYGSRVTGEAHDGSDLDLVIRSHSLEALPAELMIDLKKSIYKSTIPILVDLFD